MFEKCLIGVRDGMVASNWQESFAAAKSVGAECVELDVPADWREYPVYSEAGRKKLRELEAASGVKLVSICLGAFWKLSPSSPDASLRAQAETLLDETIKACDAYGVPYILAPFTDWKAEPPPTIQDQRKGWIAMLSNLNGRVKNARVKVGFELCARKFAHSVQDAIEIFEAAKAPANSGVYFDTANGFYCCKHKAEEDIPVLAAAKRLAVMHIKDTNNKHLGEGEVNFPAVKKALEAAKYNGPFVLETPDGDDRLASARKNLEFTKKWLRG